MSRTLRNILSGMGSVLDISPGSRYEHYQGDFAPFIADDMEALREDVRIVGCDFYQAIEHGRAYVERKEDRK